MKLSRVLIIGLSIGLLACSSESEQQYQQPTYNPSPASIQQPPVQPPSQVPIIVQSAPQSDSGVSDMLTGAFAMHMLSNVFGGNNSPSYSPPRNVTINKTYVSPPAPKPSSRPVLSTIAIAASRPSYKPPAVSIRSFGSSGSSNYSRPAPSYSRSFRTSRR